MYKKILIPLENSKSDEVILTHIRLLAKLTGAHLLLVHVADGYVARYQKELNLEDSDEIKKDLAYLEERRRELSKEGFNVKTYLLRGEPVKEILSVLNDEQCDLVAMATHGHKFLQDLILGSVAESLRHQTNIPVLMIRTKTK